LVLGGWFLFGVRAIADTAIDDFDDLMNRPPWASCTYCHGATGEIDDPTVPALAGQSARYLRKQIADFRAGRRIDPSGMMTSALVLLDPEDDTRVTDYFALQPDTRPRLMRNSQPADPRTVGESLFWNGKGATPACATCHVAAVPGAPVLDGLNELYIVRQLIRFRSGERSNDENGSMRSVAASMDDEAIAAVARFISSR
jgi:cytochrome c553